MILEKEKKEIMLFLMIKLKLLKSKLIIKLNHLKIYFIDVIVSKLYFSKNLIEKI